MIDLVTILDGFRLGIGLAISVIAIFCTWVFVKVVTGLLRDRKLVSKMSISRATKIMRSLEDAGNFEGAAAVALCIDTRKHTGKWPMDAYSCFRVKRLKTKLSTTKNGLRIKGPRYVVVFNKDSQKP